MLRYMISKLISNFIKNIVIFIVGILMIIVLIPEISYDNIYFVVIICLIIYILILMIPEIVFYVQNKSYKFDYNYYRELPRDYSPSMVSYLLNMKIELKKDILADLIYLEERKIIECIDSNYKVIDNSVTWKESESHLKCLVEDIIPVADNLEKLLSLIKNKKRGWYFLSNNI